MGGTSRNKKTCSSTKSGTRKLVPDLFQKLSLIKNRINKGFDIPRNKWNKFFVYIDLKHIKNNKNTYKTRTLAQVCAYACALVPHDRKEGKDGRSGERHRSIFSPEGRDGRRGRV